MSVGNFRKWFAPSDNGPEREDRPGRTASPDNVGRESVFYGQPYPRRKTRMHDPESRLSENRMDESISGAITPSIDPARAARLVDVRIKIALGYYNSPCHLEELADILIEKLNLSRFGGE